MIGAVFFITVLNTHQPSLCTAVSCMKSALFSTLEQLLKVLRGGRLHKEQQLYNAGASQLVFAHALEQPNCRSVF